MKPYQESKLSVFLSVILSSLSWGFSLGLHIVKKSGGVDLLASCFFGGFLCSDQWKWSVDSNIFVPWEGRRDMAHLSLPSIVNDLGKPFSNLASGVQAFLNLGVV